MGAEGFFKEAAEETNPETASKEVQKTEQVLDTQIEKGENDLKNGGTAVAEGIREAAKESMNVGQAIVDGASAGFKLASKALAEHGRHWLSKAAKNTKDLVEKGDVL